MQSHHSSPDQGEQQLRGGAIANILADRLTLGSTRVGKRGGGGQFSRLSPDPVCYPGHCQRDSVAVKDDGYHCIL
jgi:hypothetical protein